MAIPYTAGSVVSRVSSLMNDTAQTQYTFAACLPYLNMALDELQETFELNDIPVTHEKSAVLELDAGDTVIAFGGSPALPADLVEIKGVWESARDANNWTEMTRKSFIPNYLEGQAINQFLIYSWIDQEIRVPVATQDNDIKLDYIKDLFAEITDPDDDIEVLNAKSYLYFKTAALCAMFIAENETRAESLNSLANDSIETSMGISIKAQQAIKTRRRPFRWSYRRRRIIA